jgi:hypothetical protein
MRKGVPMELVAASKLEALVATIEAEKAAEAEAAGQGGGQQ